MALWDEKINEFTDWVNGSNSLTGGNDTGGLSVSGGRIRELLQERLKEPLYIWRDKDAHLYRIFSSAKAQQMWETAGGENGIYSKLELSNFVAPSEYSVKVNITSGGVTYAREGIEDQDGAKIKYTWETSNDKGDVQDENMYVTYTILETGKGFTTTKIAGNNTVVEDMTPYLSSGTNTIKMQFRGMTTGATAEKTPVINVVKLNITTDLVYTSLWRNLSQLQFGMYADRNVRGPLTFYGRRYYYGSNTLEDGPEETVNTSANITALEENNYTPSADYKEYDIPDLINMKAGMHVIQTYGKMVIDTQNFYSNLLYYIIAVAYSAGGERKLDAIALKYNFDNIIDFVGPNDFAIRAKQYEPISFDWGYMRYVGLKSADIDWYLRDVNTYDLEDKTETFIATYKCEANQNAPTFIYTPTTITGLGRKTYLVAYRDGVEIIALPINISKSSLEISETGGIDLQLKLSAYGRQNNSSTVDVWEYGDYSATFGEGVKWNTANGWYNNSLRLSGLTSSAIINYNPFYNVDATTKGATVEIEFESEYVQSNDDELIRIGGTLNTDPHISIYPNRASLYIQGNPIITTNYKANEKVKLTFIIEPSEGVSDEIKNVIFIVNNGIAERAAGWKGYNASAFNANSGNIKFGGVNSGVRVYNMRCYSKAITITNAYNNYVYDSDNKHEIVSANNIYSLGEINMPLCRQKLDVIVIKGNLSNVLSRNTTKSGSNTACDITRYCINDPTKDFTVTHGRIRKHGQSTLNYPLTSYKIWTWSSVDETRPTLVIDPETPNDLPFTKNRYQMKNDAIPSNKFVLQANYADSSGVHNGGFLKLIQETWFNAKIDGEYKLRTQPQLFTTNQKISLQEGDNSTDVVANNLFTGCNAQGKQWKDYFGDAKFPYELRTAPDSFPCLVFYQNDDAGDTAPHFLGQYVFMDDKKSDYTYGQRSIYKVEDRQYGTNNANDPFCVKMSSEGTSLWDEKNGTKIWDNDNVLRIECLSVNSTLADFRGDTADNSHRRYDNVVLGTNEDNTSIGWEEDFELVYPEKEEITTSKVFDPNKFVQTVKPFTDWLGWLISTHGNQQKFQEEAPAHLDLYKIAAYYIFVLRFGLVDSLERNAQIKTYDGKHFHYEPWDMDIALGNRNTGGIAFDPPIDRNTMMDDNTAAISGRSRIDTDNDTIPDTMVSNWLFDALEAWPYWMNEIVPKVAAALTEAGLDYPHIIKVLDEDYQNAWCESIYNESGNFKYIVNRQNVDEQGNIQPGFDDSWLSWLQGARTTHRHWWLKTSMDYYDAKWGVGEFMNKSMYIGCEMHNVQGNINIIPTGDTYFSFMRERTKFGPYEALAGRTFSFDTSIINSGAKVPFKFYGANFIKEIDISDIASGLQMFSVANSYSSEVGPIITKVNIGVKLTQQSDDVYVGQYNNKELQIAAGNALNGIEELNIRGQHSGGKSGNGRIGGLEFLENAKTIKKIYALGSGMYTLSTAIGTDFDVLELPDTLTSITFNSTTWDSSKLSFWTTTPGSVTTHTYTQEATDDEGNVLYEEDGITPIMEEYTVDEVIATTYTKYKLPGSGVVTAIPRSLNTVIFKGTTGKNACARQFVGDWIDSIIAWGTEDWTNQVEGTEGFTSLDEYLTSLFNERNLQVENIFWDNTSIPGLSYEQLSYIAKFNNIDYTQSYTQGHPNVRNFSRGYVRLTDGQMLTGIQTSYLSTWFGDSAFTLNGAGLTIDQELDYTSISVGSSAYVDYDRDDNGDLILDNNDQPITMVWLKEGESARISATKFRLQSQLTETEFLICEPGGEVPLTSYVYPAGSGNVACSIESNEIGGDFIYYLKAYPNATGRSYYIDLVSGANRVRVHIKALDYPEEIFLSAQGDTKEENAGNSTSFYKYFKSADLFALGAQSGPVLFGVQFKENGRFVNTPKDKSLTVEYAKFKLYKEGVLCTEFTNGFDYDYFTKDSSIRQTFVDSSTTELSYTTGYKPTGDTYKYYIPLYIQNSVSTTPTLYTLTADIKIGGMIRTLSQNFVLVKDSPVAAPGSVIWGLINHAYVQQFGENYPEMSFYKSICKVLTGTVSVDGQYQQGAQWVYVYDNLDKVSNLLYNGESIFISLPNITGIKLDGLQIPSASNNIVNVDLTNITKLRTFSIQNCTGLTSDFDLTNQSDLLEVDASGTTVNVLVPTGTKVTKYEVGAPTSISLINPTQLTPNGIVVDSYANIDSIDIVNIADNKSFSVFDKITKTYIYGGTIQFGVYYAYNGTGVDIRNGNAYSFITSAIPVTGGHEVVVSSNLAVDGFRIYENGNYQDFALYNNQQFAIYNNVEYITLNKYFPDSPLTSLVVRDVTTDTILFEYRGS